MTRARGHRQGGESSSIRVINSPGCSSAHWYLDQKSDFNLVMSLVDEGEGILGRNLGSGMEDMERPISRRLGASGG